MENDDDSDDGEPDNVFMKAEQPFIMHETLKWIKERAETKKNDKNFLKNFRLKETALKIKEKLDKKGNDDESNKEREERFNDAKMRIPLKETLNVESTLLTTTGE